jgi:hypothetical protein
MNVHWRLTQKIEFQKNKIKIVFVIITGNISMAEQRRKEITTVLRFFFQQQQQETNIYFLLNNKQQQWPSMSNITSLPLTIEKTKRREEKEEERHKKA